MAHPHGIKIFYDTTGSKYHNLNLDIEINRWAERNSVKILNTTLSTGRKYVVPGRQVTHYDIFATVLFEKPTSGYTSPSAVNSTSIEFSNLTGNQAEVNWAAASVSGNQRKIDFYLVYLREVGKDFVLLGKTSKTTFQLDNLKQDTSYEIKIITVDELVLESSSSTKTFVSIDNISPLAPTNLVVSDITQTSAYLVWQASIDSGSGISHYEIYNNGSTKVGHTTNPYYLIEILEKNTTYNITVKAVDKIGNYSLASSPIIFTTLP